MPRSSPQARQSPWAENLPLWLAWGALALILGLSYTQTITDLATRWSHEPDYSHGFLVPLVAAALLWTRRKQFPVMPWVGSWWGLALLGGSVAMRLCGEFYYYALLHAYSLPPALAGICLLVGGWRLLRWALPGIGFLLFMIPLPEFIRQTISLPLQQLSTTLSVWLLQTLGEPAVAAGNTILINAFQLEVVAACSGLRLFVALSALAVGFTLFARQPTQEKLILFSTVLPVAVFANVARLTVTGLLYQDANTVALRRMLHDGAGWLMIPLAVMMMAVVSRLARRVLTFQRLRRIVLLAVCLLLLASLIRYLQFDRNALRLLADAHYAEQRRDWTRAAESLRWYLRLRPEDSAAKLQLALIADKTTDTRAKDVEVADYYRAAIVAVPGRHDLRERYLELLLKLGRLSEAEQEAAKLLAISPRHARAERIRALARFMQWSAGRPLDAQSLAEEVRRALDLNTEDYALLAALASLDHGTSVATVAELRRVYNLTSIGSEERKAWAIEQARAVIEERPSRVEDQISLGLLLLEGGRITEAEATLRKTLQRNADDVRCHLAWIAFLQCSNQPQAAEAALQNFQRNVQLDEKLKPWMWAQANALLNKQDLAKKLYLKALAAQPQESSLQQQFVTFLSESNRLDVEQGLRAALEIVPNSPLFRRALALQLASGGDETSRQEAIQLLSTRQSAVDKRAMALLLLESGEPSDLAEAHALLKDLLATDANPADQFLLARVYQRQGRNAEARDVLEALARTAPERASYINAYVSELLQDHSLRDDLKLDRLLKGAADRFGGNRELLFNIATYRFRQRRTAEAIRLYEQVLKLSPNDIACLNNLTWLYSETPGGRNIADRYLAQAVRLAGEATPQLQDTLAMVRLRKGDPQGAVELLEELLEREQSNGELWLHLALAYEQLDEIARARAALAKATEQARHEQWLTPGEVARLSLLNQTEE